MGKICESKLENKRLIWPVCEHFRVNKRRHCPFLCGASFLCAKCLCSSLCGDDDVINRYIAQMSQNDKAVYSRHGSSVNPFVDSIARRKSACHLDIPDCDPSFFHELPDVFSSRCHIYSWHLSIPFFPCFSVFPSYSSVTWSYPFSGTCSAWRDSDPQALRALVSEASLSSGCKHMPLYCSP